MLKKITSLSYRFWFNITFIVLSTLFSINSVYAQQPVDGFPYTDSFKNPTSPGMVFGGTNGNATPTYSAFLTASATQVAAFGQVGGPPPGTNQLVSKDADGGGYLRLTRTVTNQTGYARNTRTFPTANGLSISFEYYTYGGTADGIVFFLYDADVATRSALSNGSLGYPATAGFHIGSFGGSLGYAPRSDSGGGPGVSKGFLGIGFDEFGRFGMEFQGRAGGYSNSLPEIPNWVVLRGDGDGTGTIQPGTTTINSNYEYLIGVNTSSTTAMAGKGGVFNIAAPAAPASRTAGFATTDNGYRKARIVIEYITLSQFKVNVFVDANSGSGLVAHHVIQNYIYNSTAQAPANLSYGFSSSTGGSTNVHEIRAIDIGVPGSVQKTPVATAASTTTLEENQVIIDLKQYAYDENGNGTLNWATGLDLDPTTPGIQSSRTVSGQGTFTSNGDGTVTFVPVLNYNGAVTTNYTVEDKDYAGPPLVGKTTSNAASLTITVTPVNDAPSTSSKTVSTNEDVPYVFTAADFNFTDQFDNPNANSLNAVQITTLPATGTLRLNGIAIAQGASITIGNINGGVFTYLPPANASASPMTSFTFRVQDDGGTANGGINLSAAAATMTINVLPANDPPSGIDKTITTNEDVPVTLTLADFAFTDPFDNPANALHSVIVSLPSAGTLSIGGTAIVVSTTVSSATIAAGLLVYTPPLNASGTPTATFTFQIKDDGGTLRGGVDTDQSPNTITFNVIPVNDLPTVADIPKSGLEDATINFTALDFTSKFTDVDGDALTKIKVINLPANGVLKKNGVNIAAGDEILLADLATITFVPTANFNGATTFKWNGFDGTAYAAVDANVNITITPVNDLPTVADIPKSGLEDATINFTALDFTSKFTDVDGNALTKIKVINLPANGVLKKNGVNIAAGDEILLADLATITFVPTANFNGATTFKWNGFDGTAYATVDANVNITITPVNDLPTVADIPKSGLEDATINFTALDFTSKFSDVDGNALTKIKVINLPANGVLKKNGVNIAAGDEILLADLATITFVPTANFNGATTFKWNGFDGTAYAAVDANVNITITPVNDAPSFVKGADQAILTTAGAQTVAGWASALSKGPADEASQTLTFTVTNSNTALFTVQPTINSAGVLSYTPSGTAGTATVTVVLKDDGGTLNGGSDTSAPQTFTITITAPAGGNTPPVVDNISKGGLKDTPVAFTSNDFTSKYTDATPLSKIKIVSLPPTGTLKLNGVNIIANQEIPEADLTKITYVPVAGFTGGPITFQWNGSDGTDYATTPKNVNITISATNAPPVAAADNYSTTKGGTLTVATPGVLTNDSDPDGNPITAIKVSDPVNGTLTLNPNGSFTYVHNSGTSTSDSFTYKVNDGIVDGNTVTVTISINAFNTPPVIADISIRGSKDQPVPFTSNDFSSKFNDPNGDALNKIKVVTLPPSGVLKLNGADIIIGQEIPFADLAKITFIPPAGFTGGPISFQWNGSDGTDYATIPKNVNITIAANTPPVAVADNYSTIKGGTLTVAAPGVLTNDSDADGNPITAIKVSDPVNGTLTLNSNGSFTYVHNNGASTSDSFTYKVNDGIADGNTVTVNISVLNNAPPAVSNISKTSTGFLPVTFSVTEFTSKFSDPTGDPLVKVKILTLPPNGLLKLNGIPVIENQEIPVADLGGLTFEPALNWSGTTNFTWNGSDGTSYAPANANAAITVILPSDPNAKIGLAKHLASITSALNGTYDVKFVFTAINYGINSIETVSIRDNLALAFGGASVVVKSVTAFGNLKANSSYNGSTSLDLLLGSSSLSAGEEAKVELLINVKLGLTGGTYQNSATAEGISSITGLKVTDVSTNGLKPDPVKAGDVSPSESTPIQLDVPPAFVPAGFSPNGDGTNDKFIIQNAQGKQVSLEVFNRWGNRVYKSVDYKNDWGGEVTEGFFIGRDIPDGTYYYIIIIENKDKYAGFITINR